MQALINNIDTELSNISKGSLRISPKNGYSDYYWYNSGKKNNPNGIYIPKSNMQLVSELARKDYLLKMRKTALGLSDTLETFLKAYDETKLFDVYPSLSAARQNLVTPLLLTDDEYADLWSSQPFVTKGGFDAEWDIKSMKGECMRSKSEVLISSLLIKADIPYRYEYPITLDDGITYHPDFLILNKRTRKEYYWEHLGMMDQPDYANKNIRRIDTFARNGIMQGINIIYTLETADKRTAIDTYTKYIESYLI